jgi:23S rRNA (guanosine2251-2'-O)-methyltransferase
MKKEFRLIMGKNCIREVLKYAPERIVEVYSSQKDQSDLLYSDLLEKGISIHHVSKNELFRLVQSESHQSYVAAVKERPHLNLKEFIAQSSNMSTSLVVMLDSIYDPQNLGTILRASECFGVNLLVYSKNRGSDISPVVTKTSSGASEYVPIVKVSNLAETMRVFKDAGYWTVCADVGNGSQSIYNFHYPEKTLLILGSEGEGVQKIISRTSDFLVSIPMCGKINSLNVSQAAAVFLFYYRMQFSFPS